MVIDFSKISKENIRFTVAVITWIVSVVVFGKGYLDLRTQVKVDNAKRAIRDSVIINTLKVNQDEILKKLQDNEVRMDKQAEIVSGHTMYILIDSRN